jgi:hypothetical protein
MPRTVHVAGVASADPDSITRAYWRLERFKVSTTSPTRTCSTPCSSIASSEVCGRHHLAHEDPYLRHTSVLRNLNGSLPQDVVGSLDSLNEPCVVDNKQCANTLRAHCLVSFIDTCAGSNRYRFDSP